ncbi:MFS transporter [Streptomyces sp. NPDC020742]|uniref:MFS transporter n=1 Tax=Streptomyces sp. NPDC020742 TaxID=3154897 RepID=UPI003406642E
MGADAGRDGAGRLMAETTQVPAGFRNLIADRTVRLLVICSLINSVGFFSMIPFLALYLADITSLPLAVIGAFTGSIALVGAVGALAGGVITDRAGAGSLLRVGFALYSLLSAALAVVTVPVVVLPLIVCLGGALMLVGPSLKKLMSLAAGEGGGLVFRMRFMTLSVGAALGPLLGAAAYGISHRALFGVSAALFALCLVLVHARRGTLGALDVRSEAARKERWAWTRSLRDGRFRRVLISAVLITLVFAQFESMIPLYLKGEAGEGAPTLFAVVFAVHAVLGFVYQWPAEWLARRTSMPVQAAWGCTGFAVSFACWGASEGRLWVLLVGVLAWTVGEAILMPMADLITHRIAPDVEKGAFFGALEIRYLGFFAGPILGGALLGSGTWVYFGVMAAVSFASWPVLRSRSLLPGAQ